ncbi:MAG TPA: hypothetical protein VKD90_17925 [Gemmataceae bacterium]|nr:hypothetical protein [Gemmataceae bacterium]
MPNTAAPDRYAPPDPKVVDPKIAHPLGRLRGIIRRYVTIEGVLAVLLFLAAWFWLAMLIDYGVFKLFAFDWALEAPKALRAIALILAVAALIALVVTRLVLRLTRDFSDSSLALVLEKRYPHILGDRLITAVQLADLEWSKQYGYSTDMIQKTIDDVRGRIDEIPVKQVFNWRRLWVQAGVFLAVTAGLFLLSGVAVCAITSTPPQKFVHEFRDVSAILAERDVLLRNTAWPRRAYLEVVNFPGDEMRIGRDVPSPRIRVVAYRWVVADSAAAVGWRPMTWADLNRMGEAPPGLPLQPVRDARFAVTYGPFLYGAAHPFTAPTLPADVTDVPDDPAKWPIDRVEQVFVENEEVRAILAARFRPELDAIGGVLKQLDEMAADPSNSRTLRKLKIPDEVELNYWGAKTRVDMKLRAEGNNEFAGTLSDLKETVKFHARGENYYTPTKQITLVPPPMLTELKRDEYHPAYLYHKAPFAEARDLPDEQKPYQANPARLKGVKHVLRDQAVSLTGDKSRFDIPFGAELVLSGKSDKQLTEAMLLPKPGKFPGIDPELTDPDPIVLPIEGGHAIQFEFTAANHRQIIRQTEFDIFLRDTDGVTSKRPVQIVVEEDRPPEVDVVVDVIRKIGGTYLCTPQAVIPFTRESKVRDDKGLNRVEYVFSYSEVEPMAVTLKRLEYAGWIFNSVPLLPAVNDPVYRAAMLLENSPRIRPALATVDDRIPVPGFLDEFQRRPLAFDDLKRRLDAPRPTGNELTVIPLVDYRPIEEELTALKLADGDKFDKFLYAFDLRKVAPSLKRASESEGQRTYVLTLNVVAVDTNVEADRPGVAQNKETLVFKLVSDGELLTEIAKEEAGLADKLDDAIRRVADVDNKLRSMVARLPGVQRPEQFLAEQTRSNELLEQMQKAKDVSNEVFTDYSRILQEFRVNRLPKHLIDQMDEKVVGRLGGVLAIDFPQAEEAYGAFHGELGAARTPPVEVAFKAQSMITTLLTKLQDIRAGIGQGLSLKKVISELEALIRDQTLVAVSLKALGDRNTRSLTEITVVPPAAPVNMTAGQKLVVRVPVNIGAAYNGNFTLKLDPSAGSDLKVPETLKLKEDDTEFTLEVSAGFNKGQHAIRVTPDIGQAREVRVIVK